MIKTLKALIPRSVKNETRDAILKLVRAGMPAAFETGEKLAALETRTAQLETALASLRAEVPVIQGRTADLEAALGQLLAVLRRERTVVLPPPKHLQVRVVGGYVPGFIESGFSICDDLNVALAPVRKRLDDFPRILDFGCGCGRTTRALKTLYPAVEVHGTDIDPEAIAWLQKNYARFGEFRVAPHRPPTSFENGFFDFIVGISVFTHLPEDMQFLWLDELKRITRPGGYLILTTSGEKNYKGLPDLTRRIVEEKGFVYIDDNYGQSISLPDFYQNTFHAPSYVEREWAKHFEVLEIQPARMQNHQDTVLLRNSR